MTITKSVQFIPLVLWYFMFRVKNWIFWRKWVNLPQRGNFLFSQITSRALLGSVKVRMPVFQLFYEMKLKTSKFKVLAFWGQCRYHDKIQITCSSYEVHTIRIKYCNTGGSGNPPSLIPALRNISILLHKMKFSIQFCTQL